MKKVICGMFALASMTIFATEVTINNYSNQTFESIITKPIIAEFNFTKKFIRSGITGVRYAHGSNIDAISIYIADDEFVNFDCNNNQVSFEKSNFPDMQYIDIEKNDCKNIMKALTDLFIISGNNNQGSLIIDKNKDKIDLTITKLD